MDGFSFSKQRSRAVGLFLTSCFCSLSAPALAAELVVLDGVLIGANDVIVDGGSYDVRFAAGTCVDLFNGCNEQSDFVFQTSSEAIAASMALRDQVFIGTFDADPEKTINCTNPSVCYFYTPFDVINDAIQSHYYGNSSTAIGTGPLNFNLGFAPSFALSTLTHHNYAVFSTSAVPEPATWAFLIFGFGAIGGAMRRQRKANVKVSYA